MYQAVFLSARLSTWDILAGPKNQVSKFCTENSDCIKRIPALNIQVIATENQSQISTLKITNKLPRTDIFIIFGEYL